MKQRAMVGRWPFLSLAVVTLIVGALWHLVVGHSGSGGPRLALIAVSILGAPFIGAMRLSTRMLGHSVATPIVGFVLGLLPYVIAEWLWRRASARQVTVDAPAKF